MIGTRGDSRGQTFWIGFWSGIPHLSEVHMEYIAEVPIILGIWWYYNDYQHEELCWGKKSPMNLIIWGNDNDKDFGLSLLFMVALETLQI